MQDVSIAKPTILFKFHVFKTFQRLNLFPTPKNIGVYKTINPKYGNKGSERKDIPHFIFQYTVEGEGIFSDKDGEHSVPKGKAFLCYSHDPETSYYYPKNGKQVWELIFFDFFFEGGDELIRELIEKYGPVFHLEESSKFKKELMKYLDGEFPIGIQLPLSEGMKLVNSLLEELIASSEIQQEKKTHIRLMKLAHNVIMENMGNKLNVKQLARKIGISPEHLSKIFREEFNITPLEYILQEKMGKACDLCKINNMSNKEIAEKTGFTHPNHFARTFKRVIGMTPKQYRTSNTL
jgi:AraC family transcriptional regulator, arabinose operon regulatory protein